MLSMMIRQIEGPCKPHSTSGVLKYERGAMPKQNALLPRQT